MTAATQTTRPRTTTRKETTMSNFFEAGTTYINGEGLEFECKAVIVLPKTGEERAWGVFKQAGTVGTLELGVEEWAWGWTVQAEDLADDGFDYDDGLGDWRGLAA